MTQWSHRELLARALRSPLGQRLLWVLFAILFYYAGLAFTTWLLQPEAFAGGLRWILVALFPILLPAFFVVNRRLGCASGSCPPGRNPRAQGGPGQDRDPGASEYRRPPG